MTTSAPGDGEGASQAGATVYVVVPTFNRWIHTECCIDLLMRQTYPSIVIVISDGGSSDGTRQRLRQDYPAVRLVYDQRERWWAGSTALGIDEAKRLSKSDDDYVLLLNNDTIIPLDYVETLVRVSRRETAAVGAKIVDSRDHTVVLDAGEFITWETYEFHVKTSIEPGARLCRGVDVLPGRGSLIPLRDVVAVGGVDDRAFPHYLADYDLFARLKTRGSLLCVTYETAILAHIEETGIVPAAGRSSFKAVWRELFSRRSMANVVDHWRFVSRHAPAHLRRRTRWFVIRRAVHRVAYGTALSYVAVPLLTLSLSIRRTCGILRRLWRERHDPDSLFLALGLPPPFPKLALLLVLPRPVSSLELRELRFEPSDLQERDVIAQTPAAGWWRLTTLRESGHGEVPTLARIAVPLSWDKLRQLKAYRAAKRSNPSGQPAAPSSHPPER